MTKKSIFKFRVVITTVRQSTCRVYISALNASVFTAIDEEVAKSMIGHQLPSSIKQLHLEPYEIINDQTGETCVFNQRSEYVPDEMDVMNTMV